MPTVPKLSYTNIKNKNKNNREQQGLELSNRSGQLFAHMNKDNLSYIQTQIKEKKKKTKPLSLSKNMQEQNIKIPTKENSLNQPKQSEEDQDYPCTPELLSPTAFPNVPITKTEGENQSAFGSMHLALEMNRKLSYAEKDDIKNRIIQNRHMDLSPISQRDHQKDQSKSKDEFLNFLQNYIADLNTPNFNNIQEKNKPKKQTETSLQNRLSRRRKQSSFAHKKETKNPQLSKFFEVRGGSDPRPNHKRLETLEATVFSLVNEVSNLKEAIKMQRYLRFQQSQYSHSQHSNYSQNCPYEQNQNNQHAKENIKGIRIDENSININHYREAKYRQGSKSQLRSQRQYQSPRMPSHINKQKQSEIIKLEQQYAQFIRNGTFQ